MVVLPSAQANRVATTAPGVTPPRAGTRRRALRPSRIFGIREEIPSALRLPLVGLSLLAPLLLWLGLYASGTVSPLFLPGPAAALDAGVAWWQSGLLTGDVLVSVRRVAYGFGAALAISIPLGLAMGALASARALFGPMISVVRYMPATAFIALLMIWFGLGEEPKIALILIGTVFFNTLMTADTVWQIPREMIRVSYTLGANRPQAFLKVVFPHCLPGIIDAARINLAAAWNLIVVAEMFAAEAGLGLRIVRAQRFLQTDLIFAVIVVIGLIGVLQDVALRLLRNRLSPWAR